MEYSHRKIFWGTALVLAAALCLLLTVAPSAGAASSSELKKQLQQLQEEQAELQSQIEALESQQQDNVTEIGQIVAEKSNLDQQVGLLYQQAQVLDQQISAYNVLIADKQEELDEAQERLDELTARNKERLRAMEEDGSLSYWSVLFNSSSFSEFLDQLSMMEEIAASDQRRLEEMSAASEEVARAKKVLAAERAELESKKAESEALQAELDVKQAEADELLARLLEKGGELEALMEEMERQEQELLASIGAKQDELDEAKKAEYQQWLSPQNRIQKKMFPRPAGSSPVHTAGCPAPMATAPRPRRARPRSMPGSIWQGPRGRISTRQRAALSPLFTMTRKAAGPSRSTITTVFPAPICI